MQYLSAFEILSQPIVPAPLTPGITLPFVAQGYFLLASRLQDTIPGDAMIKLTFFPTAGFPPATSLLVDYEDGGGANHVVAGGLAPDDSVTVPIGSGKTVLIGIQPDVVNDAASGPLAGGTFGARGYVLIDTGPGSSVGTFQLAVVPEIRATFFSVTINANGTASPNFTDASEVAYVLPTANGPMLTVTKSKEVKDKDTKERKDKEIKEKIRKDNDKVGKLEMISLDQAGDSTGVEDINQRLAALEALLGVETPFIGVDQRPKVG
jgi:hypothetical protein